MNVNEPKRKSKKRIIFDISEEDHESIKGIALKKRIPMRTWIIKAMALAIKIDADSEKIEN